VEQIFRKKLFRTIAVVSFGAILISILIWWLVYYASFLANNAKIIPFREKYFFQGQRLKNLPNKLPYTFLVTSIITNTSPKTYFYSFFGRIVRVDYDQAVLFLKDKFGREFRFHFQSNFIPENPGAYKLMLKELKVKPDKSTSQSIKYLNYYPSLNEIPGYFTPGDILELAWTDQRTLTQILKFSHNVDGVIDLNIPIIKIVSN